MIKVAPLLEARDISLTYDDQDGRIEVLRNISLDLGETQILAVVGPSGCGKTSLLRVLAGLVMPTTGIVRLRGEKVIFPSRQIGVIFQTSTLFPWLTVRGNVLFALVSRSLSKAEASKECEMLLREVGIADFADLHPKSLSGGMAQRANLARALAAVPEVLLLDEPFNALDSVSQELLYERFLALSRQHSLSAVLVTHDLDEAISLADRILMLGRSGTILEDINVNLAHPRIREGVRCEGFEELRNRVLTKSHAFSTFL